MASCWLPSKELHTSSALVFAHWKYSFRCGRNICFHCLNGNHRKNNGYVAVGTSYDTAEFAVSTIRGWWNNIGKELYPESTKLLITADGEEINGSRVKLWKYELHNEFNELNIKRHEFHGDWNYSLNHN